jgi:hypothetical protein
MNNEHSKCARKGLCSHHVITALILGILLTSGNQTNAQQFTCPNPAMEQRLYKSLVQNGPSSGQQLSPTRLHNYALCQIRIICSSGLDRIEFEMFAIDTMASFGDAQAEREKTARWSRDGRKHQSAMDKVMPPNQIDAQCHGNTR